MSWLERLRSGLERTRRGLLGGLEAALSGERRIDQRLLEEIEASLIAADVGVETTQAIIAELGQRLAGGRLRDAEALIPLLKELLIEQLAGAEGALALRQDGQPTVYLILGVNGSGKTTTIAKLARRFRELGKERIIFAAADTFRAAAMEQLGIWAERVGAELIKHCPGADPGAVAYDAVDHALSSGGEVVLIDTAGRLQTKFNLMEELKKIDRVVTKRLGRPIDERLLVLDATTGQNALSQAEKFNEAIPLTGLILTKLDSTAKGGAIFPIYRELRLPIKLIGVGEGAEDLQEFRAAEFVEALLPGGSGDGA
ncbi:MAG: signal recognition particle-docking protein FtsY [Candidatus Acetothermia bacterium]|jgi:fused signal recognition particle receptor|nr:signal recognition particle-docking protein FtsY [Candidatus Acetothermia bacterium]MDH7505737.1 signal recognition particle-docking protein FtsY [Candidatus Acetothermia bacterium]